MAAMPQLPASTTLHTAFRSQDVSTPLISSLNAEPPISIITVDKGLLVTTDGNVSIQRQMGSTGKGILIGMLSAFGSALLIALVLVLVYFFRYTTRGRILLDRMGRPGEFDDEQAFAREEEDALEHMDDISRSEYLRAKGRARSNRSEQKFQC